MLENFFNLNGSYKTFTTPDELLQHFKISNHLKDVLFEPPELAPELPDSRFTRITFENVSFSKTKIRNVSFSRCSFIDCLFIGTEFKDCYFSRCSFSGCNPYKATFVNTYIDPAAFDKNGLRSDKFANIGVGLYQQLYSNAINTHQRDFVDCAEFRIRVWNRHQLKYEIHEAKGSEKAKLIAEWVSDFGYFIISGYGLKPFIFALWPKI